MLASMFSLSSDSDPVKKKALTPGLAPVKTRTVVPEFLVVLAMHPHLLLWCIASNHINFNEIYFLGFCDQNQGCGRVFFSTTFASASTNKKRENDR